MSFVNYCQQVTRDVSSINQLITSEASFTKFFSNFADFLDQYRKPYSKSVFKKSPIKLITDVLKTVELVIKETKPGNYNRDMISSLDKAFRLLLHPDNAKKVRVPAVALFFKLMKRLDAASEVYIGQLAPLVFNFRLLQPKCSSTSNFDLQIDPNVRINAGESPKEDLETLLEEIHAFTRKLCKYIAREKFANFVYFFRTMLLDVAYPPEGARYGIRGALPHDLHDRILEVMFRIVESTKLFGLIYRRTEPLFQRYFFEVASNCRSMTENELCYLELFFKALTENHMGFTKMRYVLQGLNVLLSAQVALSGIEKRDWRKRMWDLMYSFLSKVVETFEGNDVRSAVEMLVDWPDVESLPNVLVLLLGVLLSTKCQNEEVWSVVKRGAQASESRCTYWHVLGNFATYYSFCLVDRLLKFEVAELERAIVAWEPMGKWANTKSGAAAKLQGIGSAEKAQFFKERENELALTCFPDVFRPEINSDIGVSEQFLKLMLSARWMDAPDEKEQWNIFFVTISFISPLVHLVEVIPPSVTIDISFIFDTFFDWMMAALDPSVKNEEIISCALKQFCTLVCSERAQVFHTKELLSCWYGALCFHMNSVNPNILKNALTCACKCIVFGMPGNSVLHQGMLEVKSLTEMLPADQMPALFAEISAPIKIYKAIDQRFRSSAIAFRMLKDVVAGLTENLQDEVDLCIEQLKRYEKWQVIMLQPTILLLADKLGKENTRILDCLFSLLENPPKEGKGVYEQYAQFACSMVIQCASEEGLRKLDQVSKEWNSQLLQYYLLMTAMHFSRYPKHTEGIITDKGYPTFKTSNDHILGVTENHLISAFPTGCRVWSFAPVFDPDLKENTETSTTPQNISAKDSLEFQFEAEMCAGIENYVKNMFEDSSILVPASPTDFDQLEASDFETKPVVDVPTFASRNEPASTGPRAATFMSSLSFFEPIENRRLFPSYSPMDPYQAPPFRERIEIGLVSCFRSGHLDEFKSGLGFLCRAGDGIVEYREVYREFLFHTKTDLKQAVQVVWCEGMDMDWLIESYGHDAQIRIEIRIRSDGRFRVQTLLHNPQPSKVKVPLSDVIVSKKVLPLFVLDKIMSLTAMKAKTARNVLVDAGAQMRTVTEQSFFDQDDAFSSEKALLL